MVVVLIGPVRLLAAIGVPRTPGNAVAVLATDALDRDPRPHPVTRN
ncbi:hypothetical protein [Amycolatopsis sp. cg9]